MGKFHKILKEGNSYDVTTGPEITEYFRHHSPEFDIHPQWCLALKQTTTPSVDIKTWTHERLLIMEEITCIQGDALGTCLIGRSLLAGVCPEAKGVRSNIWHAFTAKPQARTVIGSQARLTSQDLCLQYRICHNHFVTPAVLFVLLLSWIAQNGDSYIELLERSVFSGGILWPLGMAPFCWGH